jgi:hypothetical protein
MGSRWQKGTPYEPITTTPQLPAWNSDWDSMFPALVAPEVTTVRNITYNAKGEIMDILYIYNPYETERLLRQYYTNSARTLYAAGLNASPTGTRGKVTLAHDVDLLDNLFYPWRTGMVPNDCVQVMNIQAWDEYFNGIFWATNYGSRPMGGGK